MSTVSYTREHSVNSSVDQINEIGPFADPTQSQIPTPLSQSANASSYDVSSRPGQYFRSRRVKKGAVEKPWLDRGKDPREKWTTIIPLIGVLAGCAVIGGLIYSAISSVSHTQYCPVLIDDFSNGINPKYWTKEVEVGGFGNGQFEETTNTNENAFIQDGQLWIKPTLQDPSLINNNNTLDLRGQGCTAGGDNWMSCVASTNTTNGTIINPVKSARLNTRIGASIKYGRVEVVAKLPVGDWLWPAIWMLPVNQTYGPWPASGEIDIAESRGNNYTYPNGGNEVVSSTLHLGPEPDLDSYFQHLGKKNALHSTYAKGFHTYGVEWTPDYMFTYIDSKPIQVLYTKFNKPFWQRGNYPPGDANGTRLIDPWSQTGHDSTPFDQDFYLILNVAVGGTNSWFEDGVASKPWIDASPSAKLDFWNAQQQWEPTWKENGQMIVKSVKMFQMKGYNGC